MIDSTELILRAERDMLARDLRHLAREVHESIRMMSSGRIDTVLSAAKRLRDALEQVCADDDKYLQEGGAE